MIPEIWYSPDAIRFSRRQVRWLLSLLPSIREGYWPAKGNETGYDNTPMRQKHRYYKAKKENIISIAAELEIRLERTGLDGLLVKAIYCWDDSYSSLAKHLHCSEDAIDRRVDDAMRYVCGKRRKGRGYKQYLNHRKSAIHAQDALLFIRT